MCIRDSYNDIDIFTHRDAKEINLARDIALCPEVSYRVRQEALTHMVEYYHENFDADILGKYLSKIDLDYVDPSYASRINTYYIALDMYENAFEGMYRFGYVDVDIDELIKIAEFGIDDKRYDAVSYTHLDVYKRQTMLCLTCFTTAHTSWVV